MTAMRLMSSEIGLKEEKPEADHDHRLCRPLRKPAGISRLLVDTERDEKKRYPGHDHNDCQRQQEKRVAHDIDDIARPLGKHGVHDVDADVLVEEERPTAHTGRKTTLNKIHCSSSQAFERTCRRPFGQWRLRLTREQGQAGSASLPTGRSAS